MSLCPQIRQSICTGDISTSESRVGLGESKGQSIVTGKKLVRQRSVQEGLYTTGSNSEAEREKKGIGAAAKTQEGTRRSQPDHRSRQNRSQTAKTMAGTGRAAVTGSSLKCFYSNADSIVNKMSELCERVIDENYELIGITETCATEAINDAELSIEGYNMFRKDRGSRGGGLILYMKNTIRARVNEELTNSEFAESLWCNVEVDHQQLLVGLCYRSPTSTAENDEKLLMVEGGPASISTPFTHHWRFQFSRNRLFL